MRIPSLQKIDLQAKQYADKEINYLYSENTEKGKEFNSLNKLLCELSLEYREKVELKCPQYRNPNEVQGGCICKSNPLYKSLFVDKMIPLGNQLRMLQMEKTKLEKQIYKEKLVLLNKTRIAKIMYKRQLTDEKRCKRINKINFIIL